MTDPTLSIEDAEIYRSLLGPDLQLFEIKNEMGQIIFSSMFEDRHTLVSAITNSRSRNNSSTI